MNDDTNETAQPQAGEPAESGATADTAGSQAEADVVVGEVVTEPATTEPAAEPTMESEQLFAAELTALRSELDERITDLQRINAEYANYRRRVERDRVAVVEQATAQAVSALLPVLDDIDRAREHGDLVGPFATVADQLVAALAKFGLTSFGEVGDAFDPTRHEAVTHQTSAEVTAPTCVAVMRRGYQVGERLLRPALVAVADPESQ